jgi:hypothetical protein
MIVKFLGMLDIFAALLLVFIAAGVKMPVGLMIAVIVCLFLKACIAIFDIGGLTDLAIVVLMVLSFFIHLPLWLLFGGAALLGIKGLISLFA